MADFCFRDDTYEAIDINMQFKISSIIALATGFNNWPKAIDGYVSLPGVKYSMIKKSWGWDRESVAGPDARYLEERFGVAFAFLGRATTVCHYPLFQIVDGNGHRTEHFDAYLEWANTDFPECNHKPGVEFNFTCPLNVGKGTSLVGRRAS